MPFLAKNVLRLVACGVALWLTTLIVPGAGYTTFGALAATAVILWLINFTVRPILKILTIPIGCLTLGLSCLLIDVFCVWAADSLIAGISLGSFWGCALAALLVSLTSALLVE
ncbi:MAG: hypothetical protein DBY36_05250 [Clostridiales bacterium]|nr:MAG: hypothetical protein DBY36_05250 [Clostridiales bacterium]